MAPSRAAAARILCIVSILLQLLSGQLIEPGGHTALVHEPPIRCALAGWPDRQGPGALRAAARRTTAAAARPAAREPESGPPHRPWARAQARSRQIARRRLGIAGGLW